MLQCWDNRGSSPPAITPYLEPAWGPSQRTRGIRRTPLRLLPFFGSPSPLPSPTLERFPLDAHALYFRSFRLHAPSDATVFFFFFFFEVYMRYSLRIFIISNSKLKRERERERETRLPAASTIEATNRSVHLRIAIIQALRPWRARPWEESGLFLFFFFFFFGRRDLSRSRGDLRGG